MPLGALIEQILLPDWWLSRQAELDALGLSIALGSGLSFEWMPSYFPIFDDLDNPLTVDILQSHVIRFSGNHIGYPL